MFIPLLLVVVCLLAGGARAAGGGQQDFCSQIAADWNQLKQRVTALSAAEARRGPTPTPSLAALAVELASIGARLTALETAGEYRVGGSLVVQNTRNFLAYG